MRKMSKFTHKKALRLVVSSDIPSVPGSVYFSDERNGTIC